MWFSNILICYSTQSISWETLKYTALEITHHCTWQFTSLTIYTKKKKKKHSKPSFVCIKNLPFKWLHTECLSSNYADLSLEL